MQDGEDVTLRDITRDYACLALWGPRARSVLSKVTPDRTQVPRYGKIEFVVEPEEMVRRILEHIDKKRAALKLPAWDPTRFGRSGDARIHELEELSPEARAEALYGAPVGD